MYIRNMTEHFSCLEGWSHKGSCQGIWAALSQGNINTSSVTHRLPVAFMNRDLASGKRASWDRSQKPRVTQSWDPCKHWLDTASAIKCLIYISAASAAQGQPKIFLSGTAPSLCLVLWMWEYDEAGRKIQKETNNPLRLYKPTGQTKKAQNTITNTASCIQIKHPCNNIMKIRTFTTVCALKEKVVAFPTTWCSV